MTRIRYLPRDQRYEVALAGIVYCRNVCIDGSVGALAGARRSGWLACLGLLPDLGPASPDFQSLSAEQRVHDTRSWPRDYCRQSQQPGRPDSDMDSALCRLPQATSACDRLPDGAGIL